MENKIEYLSLYDFLGKPAGKELGKQVAAAASNAGIKMQSRAVENPKFKGAVILYPKDFLDFYFRPVDELPGADDWEMSLSDRQDYDDDLPF